MVPRPIAWVSTRGPDGVPNLAPFSYFAALSASPMLVGVSIGHRASGPKDSLVNIRARGGFCVNVVTVGHLEAMNLTSGEYGPEVDEFERAGLRSAEAALVDAPYVADAAAVLECEVVREVELEGAPNTLVIGRVVRVRIDGDLPLEEGTFYVETGSLRPVGRLHGSGYALPGPVRRIPRPP